METRKIRATQFLSRFIPFVPLVRALVRYLPQPLRATIWNRLCSGKLVRLHHCFTVRTEYGLFSGDAYDMLSQFVYYFGGWEPEVSELISERLRPGQTFVDVGANTGWYTVLAAGKVGPSGRVAAIEASPANCLWLKKNVAKNGLANVRLVNEAAWSTEADLSLFQGPDCHSGVSTVVPSFAELKSCEMSGAIHARPLAALLSPEEISTLRVLKIDVEGAELEAIRGLEPVLDSTPYDMEVFLELNPTEYDVDELLRPFRERGFRAWIIPNEYLPSHYLSYSRSERRNRLEELLVIPDRQIDVLLTRARP
jgi:FkbM family methyltransferase